MTLPITIEPFESDESDLKALYELWTTAQAVDVPDSGVTYSFDQWLAAIRQPLAGGGERRVWIARQGDEIVALFVVYLLEGENDKIGRVTVTVPPVKRRAGIGTLVLRDLLPELEARGRTIVEAWDLPRDGAGHRWADSLGMRTVKATVSQVLIPAEVNQSDWEVPVPEGYAVEDWVKAAPERLVASYARALSGMQDAPIGESRYQTPEWTVDRVRRTEEELRNRGVERRVVVALHEETGEVVGVTQIDLYSSRPTCAYQQDTTVVRAHRGHGLGLCIKAHMLRILRSERPEVSRIETSTNADNEHMIRINHQIGFETTRTTVGISAETAELRVALGI